MSLEKPREKRKELRLPRNFLSLVGETSFDPYLTIWDEWQAWDDTIGRVEKRCLGDWYAWDGKEELIEAEKQGEG